MAFTVTVLDADRVPTDVMSTVDVLEWQQRWMQVGGWTVVVPRDTQDAVSLAAPGAGIEVKDDDTDEVVLSGPVALAADGSGPTLLSEFSIDDDGVEESKVMFSGFDDMVWLADRRCMPPAGQGYDTRNGVASTQAIGLIGANSSGGRVFDVPYTINPDPVAGENINLRFRFQTVLDALRQIAVLGGITVTAKQQSRRVVFDVAENRDLSQDIILSPDLGNIAAATIEESSTAATVVYVAGQGLAEARTIAEVKLDGAIRRVEAFLDRRDLATLEELEDAGRIWLAENGGGLSASVDPVDLSSASFGVDYRIGDWVGVDLGGGLVAHRVIGVDVSVSAEGVDRRVLIGAESSTGELALLRQAAVMSRRIGGVEYR